MLERSGESAGPSLRREVEPPHRQPTGLGVMLIASAAMFFAVAGSAFIVRARMSAHCCDRAHPPARMQREAPQLQNASMIDPLREEIPCGRAVYGPKQPDGVVPVDFRVCP